MDNKRDSGQQDPRANVYDELGNLTEPSIPHAMRLFVMGGQVGALAGGYFFEKSSADYLSGIAQVPIFDEAGNEVGRIHQSRIWDTYINPPDWLDRDKKYGFGPIAIPKPDLHTLGNIRRGIHDRLKTEGEMAAEEFLLIGTAMGGELEDPEAVADSIMSRINLIRGALNR